MLVILTPFSTRNIRSSSATFLLLPQSESPEQPRVVELPTVLRFVCEYGVFFPPCCVGVSITVINSFRSTLSGLNLLWEVFQIITDSFLLSQLKFMSTSVLGFGKLSHSTYFKTNCLHSAEDFAYLENDTFQADSRYLHRTLCAIPFNSIPIFLLSWTFFFSFSLMCSISFHRRLYFFDAHMHVAKSRHAKGIASEIEKSALF